jgi:hypothetical protein
MFLTVAGLPIKNSGKFKIILAIVATTDKTIGTVTSLSIYIASFVGSIMPHFKYLQHLIIPIKEFQQMVFEGLDLTVSLYII